MLNFLLKLFRGARPALAPGLIPVLPKNCRSIVLRAIEEAEDPVVLVDGVQVTDFSIQGPLTRKNFRTFIDFEVRDGAAPIVGFHDHPQEMWIVEAHSDFADYCANQRWLKIQGRAS